MDIKKKLVKEPSDKTGHGPYDQIKSVGDEDINPRITKAEKSLGDAGVKTPWENSHQIPVKDGPTHRLYPYNSQGRNGTTSWEHKGAQRGGTDGPQQRENPWTGLNTDETDKLNQTY